MTRKITRIAIALLIGVIVLGASGAALALAAPAVFNGVQARLEQQARGWWPWAPGSGMGMGFGRGGAAGTVASVNANGFTATVTGKAASDTKTITVTVTSQTKFYLMPGMTAAAFSDVKVGSNVRVQGQADSSGVITAQSIVIEPAGDMVAGRVAAVNGQTVTVTTRLGRGANSQGGASTPVTTTVAIVTDSNTKFTQPGGQAATLADVKTGGFVQAWGQKQADGSLLATELVVGGAGRMGPFPFMGPGGSLKPNPPANGQPNAPFVFGRGGVAGIVASVNANGFTVTVTGKTAADNKTVTVTVTSQTKFYLMPGMTAAAFSDVKVGSNVRVQGQADSSGVITAQSIVIEPAGAAVAGKVTAVNGQTITVTTRLGRGANSQGGAGTPVTTTVAIVTDSNTKFIQPGGRAATLADVKAGGFVQAWGQKQADGSLLATEVVVGGAGRMGPFPGMGPHPLTPANPHGRWHA